MEPDLVQHPRKIDQTPGLLIIAAGRSHSKGTSELVLMCQYLLPAMRSQLSTRATRSRTPNKKRRRRSLIAFEMIQLDRTATEPLHEQLYRQIRDELISGSFGKNSSRLPSSRALAADLGISRLTVNLAFLKLHEEGYLRSKVGSGACGAGRISDRNLGASAGSNPGGKRRAPSPVCFESRGR